MRRATTAMLLCLALLMVLTGCEVVSVNREKDMQQVVAEIGDTKILKKEIYEEASSALAQDSIDIYSDSLSTDLRTQIDAYLLELLQTHVDEEVEKQMAAKMGIALTEEELKKVEDDAKETLGLYKLYYLGYDEDDPESYEGEDIEADMAGLLQQMGFESEEDYIESQKQTQISAKLKEEATKEVAATDEEVKARYDADLQAQKDVFATADDGTETPAVSPSSPEEEEAAAEEDPDTQYQTLAEGGTNGAGSYTLYKPAGYKVVKHILLELKQADLDLVAAIDDKISELNNEITPIQNDIYEVETAISDAEALIAQLKGEDEPEATAPTDETPTTSELDVESMTEDEKKDAIDEQQKIVDDKNKELEELNEKLTPYQTQLSDAEEEKKAAREKGAENLQPTVDEIVQKYEDGTDFNALIEEYNTDPGMKEGAGLAYGYLITPDGAGFVTEFSEASLALTTVGELSDPVLSDNGVHIIRLEMDDNEADMPYEKAQAVVKAKLEGELQTAKWEELMDTTWPTELGAKIHDKRLNWVK